MNTKFYLSSPKIIKGVFLQKNIFFFSNTFHKIYYGLDDAGYIFLKNSNNNKKLLIQKKFEPKNIKTFKGGYPKIWNKYKYSLIELRPQKNIKNNIFNNIYYFLMNGIKKKYNKSDTKILLSDLITSYNNLKYNFMFYLSPKTLSYISKISNIQLFSSTNVALQILNNNDNINIDEIHSIPELENKLKYIYKYMLENNFKNKNYINKKFCNDSTLLLLDTIYGKNKKYPISVELPTLIESEIIEKELKCIRFKINIIEYCLKNGKIEDNSYIIEIGKNPNIDYIKENGHNLLIKNIQLTESINMLI